MQVFLGDMELRQSEKPDFVQHGGGQHLAVNEFPGGNVSVQFFGSTYRDISWSGWFEGEDAYDRMIQIGNMRQKGTPIVFKTEKYQQNVVIKEYHPDHRTNVFIPFSIILRRIIGPQKKEEKQDAVDRIAEKINEAAKENGDTQPKAEQYIVKSGDNLSKIALKYFGDVKFSDKIYQDNKDILTKGAHLIYPGQRLVINL